MIEESPIIKIAELVCPAVITIIVSKDLPEIENLNLFPFEGQNLILPDFKKGKVKKRKVGGGSGFIVSSKGLIITSEHVVKDLTADYSIVLEPTKRYSAKVLARDPVHDIAILKIKGNNFPFLELGDSNEIKLGQEVIAAGNALGEFHDTISRGIISGLSRFITAYSDLSQQGEQLTGLIQTDAAINPGNSGGPLIDMNARVIGVNTAMVAGAQNIGFAIPINSAIKDLQEVIKYGKLKRPFLGIRYITLSKQISKKNKLPVNYGSLVVRETLGESAIVKGSPADKAGVKEFDIILECNGEKIDNKNPLSSILVKLGINQEINLKILRENKKINLKVKLQEKK